MESDLGDLTKKELRERKHRNRVLKSLNRRIINSLSGMTQNMQRLTKVFSAVADQIVVAFGVIQDFANAYNQEHNGHQ